MIKENKKKLILTSCVILVPIILGLILWNKLPDKIPTHWNAAGEVDGWSSKVFGVFGLPGILLAFHWICVLATSADPKRKNIDGKLWNIVFWICPVISMIIALLSYGTAMGAELAVEKIMCVWMGLMFIIVGNYLPKCKQSYTMGIKLPWTLNDEENWNLTHRMAGKLWVVIGFAMFLSMLLPTFVMLAVNFSAVFVSCVIPSIYSYRLYKVKEKSGEDIEGDSDK